MEFISLHDIVVISMFVALIIKIVTMWNAEWSGYLSKMFIYMKQHTFHQNSHRKISCLQTRNSPKNIPY